jgi:hypothetical protein
VLYGAIPSSFIVSILYCFSPIPSKNNKTLKKQPIRASNLTVDYNDPSNRRQELAKKNVTFIK